MPAAAVGRQCDRQDLGQALLFPGTGAASPAKRTVGYAVGNIAPELQMVTAQGTTLNLSSLRGKYVVLDMSAIWCPMSEEAAKIVRDELSHLNAPKAIAGNAPVVWITAEMESLPGVTPTPGALARFATQYGVGDALSPVVSFGPYGSATIRAASAQLSRYGVPNGMPGGGFPTFVVLDPSGVILDVAVGFNKWAYENTPTTVDRINADLGLKKASPYALRPAPFAAPAISSATIGVTVDGVAGSAVVLGDMSVDVPVPGTSLIVYGGMGEQLASTEVGFGIWSYEPLPLTSSYEIDLSNVTWATTGPFVSLSLLDGTVAALTVKSRQATEPEYHAVEIHIALDASGHVAPFTLQEALDQAQPKIEELNLGAVDVFGVAWRSHWDGPVVSTFGK